MSEDIPENFEFPKRSPERFHGDGSGISLLLLDELRGVFPSPESGEAFVECGVENFQFDRSLFGFDESVFSHDAVCPGVERGVIIPSPTYFAITESSNGGGVEISGDAKSVTVTDCGVPNESDETVSVLRFEFPWCTGGSDMSEYMLLVIHPWIVDTDQYEMLPMLVDGGVGVHDLTVLMRVTDPGFDVKFADPFVQVIPIRKDAFELTVDVTMP